MSMNPQPPVAYQSSPPRRANLLPSAALSVAAAAATVAGSFLPLFSGELRRGERTLVEMTITAWGFDTGEAEPTGAVATNGIPLVAGAALLVVAALLAAFSARRACPAVTLAGAAFLVGTVWTVAMQVVSLSSSFRPTGTAENDPSFSANSSIGIGFWLLACAAVLAVAAAVAAGLSVRRTRPPTVPGQGQAWYPQQGQPPQQQQPYPPTFPPGQYGGGPAQPLPPPG